MRKRLDVRKLIQIHVLTDGPCKGWVHTHGLAARGKPELEIRRVPPLFVASGCEILNSVAEYLLTETDRPVLPGHTMELGRHTMLLFLEGKADHAGGYDESHYREPVLTITALEPACSLCTPAASA